MVDIRFHRHSGRSYNSLNFQSRSYTDHLLDQFVFAALAAGSYGAGGSINGMLAALAAYRFLLGIGIGGEYPAGSVGCSESTGELKAGTRNRWFIWFTNLAIDVGFVVAAFVPMIVVRN